MGLVEAKFDFYPKIGSASIIQYTQSRELKNAYIFYKRGKIWQIRSAAS